MQRLLASCLFLLVPVVIGLGCEPRTKGMHPDLPPLEQLEKEMCPPPHGFVRTNFRTGPFFDGVLITVTEKNKVSNDIRLLIYYFDGNQFYASCEDAKACSPNLPDAHEKYLERFN